MRVCDLHTHSHFSDGSWSPKQLIAEAKRIGLTALALTDHNTVAGLPALLKAAAGTTVTAIPGCEFSVDYRGKELHLLALFIPPKHFQTIADHLQEVNDRKVQSNRDLCAALTAAGYPVDYDALCRRFPKSRINRAHIAEVLTENGHTQSVKYAFDTLLHTDAGYYVPPPRPTVEETIAFVRELGAAPVLAHPFLQLDEPQLREFLPSAKQAGLLGLEVYYTKYDEATTRCACELAAEFELLPSGGSDFHGDAKPDTKLGVGTGQLAVPTVWAEVIGRAVR